MQMMITYNVDVQQAQTNGTLVRIIEVGPDNKFIKILNIRTNQT